MRTHPAALTLPGGKFPEICNSAVPNASANGKLPPPERRRGPRAAHAQPGAARHSPGSLPRYRGALLGATPPSHFLPPRAPKVPQERSRSGSRHPTMNFCIAVLLVLQSLPGKAEVEDDTEEIASDLYEYVAHLSNYYYSTEDYYYDNITATPATYVYEFDSYETNTTGEMDWENWFPEWNDTTMVPGLPDTNAPGDSRDAKDSQDFQGSLGSSLQSHLTLIILLSFLGLLL
ncbi:unnamed protein product [Coccothraustes coccothraustes]